MGTFVTLKVHSITRQAACYNPYIALITKRSAKYREGRMQLKRNKSIVRRHVKCKLERYQVTPIHESRQYSSCAQPSYFSLRILVSATTPLLEDRWRVAQSVMCKIKLKIMEVGSGCVKLETIDLLVVSKIFIQ